MSEFVAEAVGMLESNCYVVFIDESRRLYIIDPGADTEKIVDAAKKYRYDEAVILLTHAHVDHIGATRETADALNVKQVCLHPADLKLYNSPDNNLLPFIPAAQNLPAPAAAVTAADFEIIETPGHTPGGVCFYFKQFPAVFVGDTIFAGSIGRTDLPGGDTNTLLNSIRTKLMVLPDDMPLYPGHGPGTSVAREKRGNPFL